MIKAAEKILGMVADKFAVLSILEDLEDRFIRDCTDKGKGYALINFISRYLLVLSSFIIESINWRIIMFRNYLKIAIRDLKNQKAFSAIKIFSLSIGLATSVLILIWVQYELSFDMFHENSDSIYRMASSYEFNGIERTAPWFPRPMGPALKESFPEIIDFVRYDHRMNFDRIQYGDVVDYGSTILMTDRSFLEVFDFKFLAGNPETALSDLNSVVITEKMAAKFFGDEDPVGKILLFLDKKIPTKITGVLKHIPENSHIQFDYLVPAGIADKWWGIGSDRNEWDFAYTDVYLQIRDDFVKDDLERRIVDFYKQKSNTKGIENIEVWLEPLSDIHLRSNLFYDNANNSKGNIIHVYVFIFIAVSVLFIACVNFMNLSTARSAKRSLEVGIRKVNGAYRKDIIKQFLSESVFLSFVALMIAIVFVYTLIPVLRELSGRELDLSFLDNGKILLYVLLITLGTGLISGSYPAFFLSSFDLVSVLKSKFGSGKISFFNFRRFLVVFQFLCTTVLIVISLVIYFQLDFIKNKDLGFDKENILSFTYHRGFWGKFDTLKEELLRSPNITYVTSGFSPSMNKRGHAFGGIEWEGKTADQNV
ncbi:MAG: FtsX-like permease family protein, partial [bacterium]|nr:FtsX-like permease family protein [bacterium]